MNNNAMFKLSYGLFVLTAKDDKDNGCIINTAMQVTTTPNRIIVTVNKENHTHDMILATRRFNVSVLSEEATFDIFRHFGFQSGKTVDKFADFSDCQRSANGLLYLTAGTNAYISGEVISIVDCGTHSMFIADVVDAEVLNEVPSATYAYYHAHIKPKPEAPKTKGWRCKICGYVHESPELPADFICPWCKHGAIDFEPIA